MSGDCRSLSSSTAPSDAAVRGPRRLRPLSGFPGDDDESPPRPLIDSGEDFPPPPSSPVPSVPDVSRSRPPRGPLLYAEPSEGEGEDEDEDGGRTEEGGTRGAEDNQPTVMVAWLAEQDDIGAVRNAADEPGLVVTTNPLQRGRLVSEGWGAFCNKYVMAAMAALIIPIVVTSGAGIILFLRDYRLEQQHQQVGKDNTVAPSAILMVGPTASPSAVTHVPPGMDWSNSSKIPETPSSPSVDPQPSLTTTGSYWNLWYTNIRTCSTGYSVDISADGSTVAVDLRITREQLSDQSCNYWRNTVKIYRFGRAQLPEHKYEILTAGQYHVGNSIALSEDGMTLAVGFVAEEMVQVFRLHEQSWERLGKTLRGDKCQGLGWSVALANDRLAVASSNTAQSDKYECDRAQSDLGMVQIYDLIDGEWVQVSPNLGDDAKFQGSAFGSAIAISRDGRVVAAHIPSYNSFQNSVSVLYQEVQSGQWVRMGQGIESGKLDWGYGSQNLAVSANGKRFAVAGMKKETGSAYVKVMEWRGRMWEQVGDDIEDSDDCCFSENFPASVSLSDSGTRLVFGNSGFGPLLGEEAYNPGIVRIYDWNGASWVQVGQSLMIDPPNENPETWFGFSTAISAYGGRVVVAAGKGGVHGIYDLIA